MAMALSEAAVRQYKDEGYYHPIDAISTAEAGALRATLEDFEGRHGSICGEQLKLKPYLLIPWLNDLIRTPAILDAVESLIGPNILAWGGSFFIKEANNPSFVSWHQDSTYIGLEPPDLVTAWIAISDSNASNGALRVIPRTHNEQLPHVDTFRKDSLLSRGQELTVEVDEDKAVMLELKAGQFSVHDARLIHGSDPNPSNDRRIGYVARYIPTYMKQIVGDQDSATLVRGVDEYNHFIPEPRPKVEFDPDCMAFRDNRLKGLKTVLLQGTDRKSNTFA
jgi:non-haem Fe2+, alpha-ketoglutarate-dependent halogenase